MYVREEFGGCTLGAGVSEQRRCVGWDEWRITLVYFFFLVMYQVAPLELRGEVRKSIVEGGDGRERGGSVVAFSMVFSLMVLCMVVV